MYKCLFKRVIDFFSSMLILGFVFIPLVLILIIVRLDSKGSPIFFQKRVGRNGREFVIYKIRTMTKIATMAALDPTTVYETTKVNDPRITKIGSTLRKFHIDEIPQFINVLKGDMSLVGPRPDEIRQKFDYSEREWHARNSVKPGITGLSQIKSSSKFFNHKNRLRYDLFYANHDKKFLLDLMIMVKTIKKISTGSSH